MAERLKNKGKGFWAGIAFVLALVITVTFVFSYYVPVIIKKSIQEVHASFEDYEGDDIYIPNDASQPKFRKNAKFKILEIVPYRGMAEIGYGIAGEEPIDIREVNKTDWKSTLVHLTGANDPDNENKKDVLSWSSSKGYLVNNSRFVRDTLRYALELTETETESYVEQHSVDVLVVEPDTINDNPNLIDSADYIYIHDNFYRDEYQQQGERLLTMYNKYSKESSNPKFDAKERPRFKSGNDLSMDTVKKLYRYALIKKMPITMSGYAIREEGKSDSNFQKMAYSISLGEFFSGLADCKNDDKIEGKYPFNQFSVKVKEVQNILFADSYGSGDANSWSIKPLVKNIAKDKVESNEAVMKDHVPHIVYDKLVARYQEQGSGIVNQGFVGSYKTTTVCTVAHGWGNGSMISSKIYNPNTEYPDSVFDLSNPLKQYCKGIESDTRAIAVCINNSLKPIMNVLEIEPDNSFVLDEEDIRSWINEDIGTRIVIEEKTMSEFIGLADDLNCEYDLIYFGKSMDQIEIDKLYSNGVDAVSSSLATYQGTYVSGEKYLYSGNDMTERMAKRVRGFIDAGYPVVYEGALSDPDRINTNTKVYEFMCNTSGMYKAQDKMLSGKIKDEQIDTKKPQVFDTNHVVEEYKESGSAAVSSLHLKVGLKYGEGKYKVCLYIDTDHNGVYERWVKDGGSYKLSDMFETPAAEKNMTAGNVCDISAPIPENAKLGVVSWKVEVIKLDASDHLTGIRSCLKGNTKVADSVKTIQVLQLSDLSDPSTPDLSKNSTPGAAKFLELLRASQVSDRFQVSITTKDIYTSKVNELEIPKYDVIIVGFINQDKKMDNANGLLNRLTIEAGKGKGIIFTRDALSYFNNPEDSAHWGNDTNRRIRKLLGMDQFHVCQTKKTTKTVTPAPTVIVEGETPEATEMTAEPTASVVVTEEPCETTSEKMGFTYNLLNIFSGNKYFRTLTNTPGEGSFLPSADCVERINEAKVARYPYVISIPTDGKIRGFNSASGIYQVDVEEDLVKGKDLERGVGYFCLSNSTVEKPTSNQIAYAISPKDIKNNYYLWRFDTVFYSGISKEAFADTSNETELKLFVNTIISAYGLQRYVEIDVTNLTKLEDFAEGKTYFMYADIDYNSDTFEGEKNIEFKLSTKNLNGSDITVNFYRADNEGNKMSSGDTPQKLLIRKEHNTFRVDEGAGKADHDVSVGPDYTFKYPLKFMGENAGAYPNIIIEVVKDLNGIEVKDTALIQVVRRSMFELD